MKTIAVDIDDVLAANAAGFVAFSNERWGTTLTVDDYDEHWAKVWGVDMAETEARSDEFQASGRFIEYEHFQEAKEVLEHLAKRYKLVITTSRRLQLEKETTAWLDRCFPNIFQEVHYAGIWDKKFNKGMIHQTKAELCRQVGADYLIDDQLKHCTAVAEAGMQGLLFGDYTWNQADHLPKGVTRVNDWHAVREYFDAAG